MVTLKNIELLEKFYTGHIDVLSNRAKWLLQFFDLYETFKLGEAVGFQVDSSCLENVQKFAQFAVVCSL